MRRSYILLLILAFSGCRETEEVEKRAAEQQERAAALQNQKNAIMYRFEMKLRLARELADGRISLEDAANALVELNKLDPEVATMLRRREKTDDDFEAAAKDIIKMVDSPASEIDAKLRSDVVPKLRDELAQVLAKRRGVVDQTPPKSGF